MAKKTTHSANYQTVRSFYARGLWDIRRVSDAVEKNWITADEYKEITGESYAN